MFGTLQKVLRGGENPSAEVRSAVESFDREGYAVLRGVIDPDLCDQFWHAAEGALATEPALRIVAQGAPIENSARETPFGPLYRGRGDPDRIIDIEACVEMAPQVMLHDAITGFLRPSIGGMPTCIQTLTYSHSSQQAAHSDKYLVSPRAAGAYERDTLAAAWIALEEATDENGALLVWPASHRLQKPRLKEDLDGDYPAYTKALQQLCDDAGIEPIRFFAEKGDVLFWHGDLIHGGGKILNKERTRKSLVCHYAVLDEKKGSRWREKRSAAYRNGAYFVPAT